MIPVKVQCDCGQRYAFDVEPVHGRVPAPVTCPACGTDGTSAANAVLAQILSAQAIAAPAGGARLSAPTPVAVSIAPSTPPASSIAQAPASRPAQPPPLPSVRKTKRGRDGWSTEESSFNKLGTYITVGPSLLAALVAWGIFGIDVPTNILCVVVGVCGLIGGAINIAGRGPLLAGAFIGLVLALGGYGAVYWWVHDRQRAYKFELAIAFAVGAAPGFLLQFLLQHMLRKRAPQHKT